jgi:hypothetical protein
MEEALARSIDHEREEPSVGRQPPVRPSARQVIHSGYMVR